MVSAMKAKVGSSGRKLVLIKLADNANDEGFCWPSYQHVADQCEMGRSTVKEHIKKLEECGFLRVESRNDGKSSNRYLLTIERGTAPEKYNGTRSESNPVEIEPGQENNITRSESAPPTRSGSDPRTYHSFEPITEPVNKTLSSVGESQPLANCENHSQSRALGGKRLLPDNFALTEDMVRDAKAHWLPIGRTDLDPKREFELFVAHYRSQGGQSAHWPSEWKKWVIRAVQFNRPAVPAPNQRGQPPQHSTRGTSLVDDLTDQSWAQSVINKGI